MIRKFYNRALDALDRIYGIEGGISRVDLIGLDPVQLVHDVSREAEAAMGFVGNAALIFAATDGLGNPSYGSLTRDAFLAQADVRNELATRGLDPSEVDVWVLGLMGVLSTATAANFAAARQGVRVGSQTGGGVIYPLVWWTNEDVTMVSGGVTFLRTGNVPDTFGQQLLPILVPDLPNSAFLGRVQDDGVGPVTCTMFWRCWIGPKGSFPPGA